MMGSKEKSHVNSLIQAGRFADALRLLTDWHRNDSNDVEIWHFLSLVHAFLGDFRKSAVWSGKVVENYPRFADAWMTLAKALDGAGNFVEALDACQKYLEIRPADINANLFAAGICRKQGDTASSLRFYHAAVRARPDAAELHYNLGTAYQELADFVGAENCYLRALGLKPDLLQASNNLGLVYQAQRRFDEALSCFNRALGSDEPNPKIEPRDSARAEIHRHRSLLWLMLGCFGKGWAEYEWRHTDPLAKAENYNLPRWTGGALEGKTILVAREQGVGDEIMFASCIPDLVRTAGRVIVECDARLEPLYRRSFPDIATCKSPLDGVCSASEGMPDFYVPCGSLPRYFRTVVGDFPGRPYLYPDPGKVNLWRERYQSLGAGPKVGISWRGGAVPRARKTRSTDLSDWMPILQMPGVHVINLQYGDCSAELAQVSKEGATRIADWPDSDPLVDLDGFSAQIAALDLVISVDNATVHLAGALGVPTWVLQPFVPEWRWLVGRDDSYWYSGIRQFRQLSPGDWQGVFGRVCRELSLMRGNKKGATP